MSGPSSRYAAVLAAAVSVAFAALVHFALVDGLTPTVGAILSLVPACLVALWAVRRARHRGAALAALALAALGLWLGWSLLEAHFANLFFVEHAGANLALAIVFGRTLVGEREPLCTTFARVLHGTLPPEVVRYSRRVTIAWTLFFAVMFAMSCILFFAGQVAAWSILANGGTPVLLALMFVVEYAVRHRVLPQWERVGVLGSLRAFSRHFGAARVEAPR